LTTDSSGHCAAGQAVGELSGQNRALRQANYLPLSGSFAGRNRMWRDLAQHLMYLSPLLGVLQNDTAPMIIDDPPFFDFLERSKAAEADKVIV
jgi:hypothetical protein